VRVMSLRHARYPFVNLPSTLYERTSLGSDIASNRTASGAGQYTILQSVPRILGVARKSNERK